jgi:hypothetical protein
MSRTEKEILWWEGAALAPPSCHASMPAACGPGGRRRGVRNGSARVYLWLWLGRSSLASELGLPGQEKPRRGEEAGREESHRGAARRLALARLRPPVSGRTHLLQPQDYAVPGGGSWSGVAGAPRASARSLSLGTAQRVPRASAQPTWTQKVRKGGFHPADTGYAYTALT